MDENKRYPNYVSILEVNNSSVKIGWAYHPSELLAALLANLESAAEGARGYIQDTKTGTVLQCHHKVAAL